MLAQDCLKQEPSVGEQKASESQPFEGPELLAQTIDSGQFRRFSGAYIFLNILSKG